MKNAARPAGDTRPSTVARARRMALRLGERLVREAAEIPFDARGLGGASGRALAFDALAMATGDSRYEAAARDQLRAAAAANDVPHLGLFTGISGLRGVAALLALREQRYLRLAAQCDAFIDARLPTTHSVRVLGTDDFDLIAGWSGIRLARCATAPMPRDRLVDLLAWTMRDDARWCRIHPLRSEGPPENDLGLAHGIAGVLASVALTTTPLDRELRGLLSRQARALIDCAVRHDGRVGWPAARQAPHGSVVRSAWCYGAPGVAAALYWTGMHLRDETIRRVAIETLEGEAKATAATWLATDHALCHGTLGNALVFLSVGTHAENDVLVEGAEVAVAGALDGLERDDAACWGLGPDMRRQDLSGELDGAAGIALALLTIVGDYPSAWLRLHALQPFSSP